jgi:glycosyltransferase involved in cell wall biosynthesis
MKFIFYSPAVGGPWDWSSLESGVGGSETFHLEMAMRLARRGHEVISYNSKPDPSCFSEDVGVDWRDLTALDSPYCSVDQSRWSTCADRGIWVIQRDPRFIDRAGPRLPTPGPGKLWHVYHDVGYPPHDTPERMARYDRIIALSAFHAEYLRNMGHQNVTASHGGIAVDRMCDLSARIAVDRLNDLTLELSAAPAMDRDPARLIYASAPERSLLPLLRMFARAKEHVAALELHVYYGWEGYDRQLAQDFTGRWAREKAEMLRLLEQPGVTWHGRVTQTELWMAYLQSGIWVYPTEYPEVCCVTAMEAQALGAVPIFTPTWALQDHVFAGIKLDGACSEDRLAQARFAYEIVRLASSPAAQDAVRWRMMAEAGAQFDWENVCDQFEQMAAEDLQLSPVTFQQSAPAAECGFFDVRMPTYRSLADMDALPAPGPQPGNVTHDPFVAELDRRENETAATVRENEWLVKTAAAGVGDESEAAAILFMRDVHAEIVVPDIVRGSILPFGENERLHAYPAAAPAPVLWPSDMRFGDDHPKDVFARRKDGSVFGGWFGDENKRHLAWLIEKYKVKTVCEIGCFLGYSTAWFARRVDQVYCVDKWVAYAEDPGDAELLRIVERLGLPHDFYDSWRRNMEAEGLFHKVTPVRGFSVASAHLVPDVDLVYVDGDHTYTGCMTDIALYGPKALSVICGDDFGPAHPGIQQALESLRFGEGVPYHHDGPFWWIEHPARYGVSPFEAVMDKMLAVDALREDAA